MKITIVLLLLCTSLLNAQTDSLSKLKSDKKSFFSHQSISLGGGFVFFDKENIPADFSISTTFHFANSFHFEIKVDNYTSKHLASNIYSFLPQVGFNLHKNKWKMLMGLGPGIHNSKNDSYYLVSTSLKFEYFFSNSYSVNTETIFWPPMQKLNFSYHLPY